MDDGQRLLWVSEAEASHSFLTMVVANERPS